MDIMNIARRLLIQGKHFATNHAPGILMGMGTAGVGTALIMTIQSAPKATYLIEEAQRKKAEEERKEDGDAPKTFLVPLTKKETVRATWRLYLPPIGIALFSVGCFWAAHGIDLRRQAVIAGLYSTAEATLQEYQRKVSETIGKDGEREVRRSVEQDRIEKNPPPAVIFTGPQNWFIIHGKYFPATYNSVKKVENEANHRMMQQMYLSESELFWMLDPSGDYLRCDGDEGQVGWSLDKLLVLHIEPGLDPEGRPVFIVTYEDEDGFRYDPRPGYSKGL